jgi:hypothetical protein
MRLRDLSWTGRYLSEQDSEFLVQQAPGLESLSGPFLWEALSSGTLARLPELTRLVVDAREGLVRGEACCIPTLRHLTILGRASYDCEHELVDKLLDVHPDLVSVCVNYFVDLASVVRYCSTAAKLERLHVKHNQASFRMYSPTDWRPVVERLLDPVSALRVVVCELPPLCSYRRVQDLEQFPVHVLWPLVYRADRTTLEFSKSETKRPGGLDTKVQLVVVSVHYLAYVRVLLSNDIAVETVEFFWTGQTSLEVVECCALPVARVAIVQRDPADQDAREAVVLERAGCGELTLTGFNVRLSRGWDRTCALKSLTVKDGTLMGPRPKGVKIIIKT